MMGRKLKLLRQSLFYFLIFVVCITPFQTLWSQEGSLDDAQFNGVEPTDEELDVRDAVNVAEEMIGYLGQFNGAFRFVCSKS